MDFYQDHLFLSRSQFIQNIVFVPNICTGKEIFSQTKYMSYIGCTKHLTDLDMCTHNVILENIL